MAHLIEIIAMFGLFALFTFVIVPLGGMAMAGFLALYSMIKPQPTGNGAIKMFGVELNWRGTATVGFMLLFAVMLIGGHR